MKENFQDTSTPDETSMLARYHRAEAWEHEVFNDSMVLHARVSPNWIGDSHCFWYQRINKTSTDYRLVDAKAGTNISAFDHKKLAAALSSVTDSQVSGAALPISNLDFTDCFVSFEAFGKSWQFNDYSGLVEIDITVTHPADWIVSPDGKKAVFLRDYNLWLCDLESGDERALTSDGSKHYSYASQPEGRCLMTGTEGKSDIPERESSVSAFIFSFEALWSPDSRKVFTLQLDERKVETMPSIIYAPQDGTLRPRMIERKYSLPGDKHIAEYRLLILDVDTGQEIPANYARVEDSFVWHGVFSGNRAWWSGDSKKAYFLDMARGQKSVRVVELLADTGQTRVLFDEYADTYLEIGHNFEAPTALIPIPATDELIWFSQRSGFAHLYLYDLKTGGLKNPITSGDWSVSAAPFFDVDRREVFVQLMGRETDRDFYYQEVARIHVDTGDMTVIASGDYDYNLYNDYGGLGGVAPSGEYFVSTHSRINLAPVTDLRDRDGEVILTLETSDTSALPMGWEWPEPIETVAADGRTPIYGAIFLPANFDPDKRYPVLDFCHSNPFYAAVPKQAFGGYFEVAAAFAELGMVVVMMDGRGTSFRDKVFRDYGYEDFLENGGIRDRVAGIQQLGEQRPYMDLNRVGIIDFDGSNAGVTGLLAFPDFYQVGVASSLYDPRLVKQGEVYMGLTTEEKRNQAVIWGDSVKNLKGKLLIITGLRDDFFHPGATFQLTDALFKANKSFEHLVQPNGGHGWRLLNGRRRMWDFLVKNLLGENVPPDFSLVTGLELAFPDHMTEIG